MLIQNPGKTTAGKHVVWLAGAVVVGFGITAVFAGLLRLPRNLFLVSYCTVMATFLSAYVHASGLDVGAHFRQRPLLGLLGAALAGAFVVSNVLSQPTSPRPEGWELVFSVLWAGVVYGVLDALFLSVMPVIAVWLAFEEKGLTVTLRGRLATAGFALIASLLVTAAYHVGYPEFQGPPVVGPIIGNVILTTAYLVTRSPLSAILAHVAMHVASVLHGMETTIQLPPHY